MPDLTLYLQRMSYLMRQGTPQNDVALYLPNADAYAHMTAGKVHLIDMEREMVGDKIMPAIFEAGYNLDFFDDEMLKTVGKIDKGTLALGASKHRIVVLPSIERMPIESLRKLEGFVKEGGILIATRRMPSMVPGLKATPVEQAEFKATVQRLFGGTNASVKFVEKDEDFGAAVRSLLKPDAEIAPSGKDFGFVHRQTAESDIYFVANTSNQKKNVRISFRSGGVQTEVWDAMKGPGFLVEAQDKNAETTTLALDFEPYQSHIVTISKKSSPTPKMAAPQTIDSVVDLASDWRVALGQSPAMEMKTLRSWAENESTRYFSGTATYEKSFDLTGATGKTVVLDFGEGQALEVLGNRNGMQTWYDPPIREAAVIYVNGQKAGSVWAPPYKIDVTRFVKPGRNALRIVVGNTALNYMSGRKLPDYKLLNLRYGERFQPQEMEKIQVLPSGLVGTVKLISMK